MTRFQILKTSAELDSIRSEWKALARLNGSHLFQRYRWNRLAAEMFAVREAPHVVAAARGAAMVVLPLAVRTDGVAALLGEKLFDYRDMLSSGDAELEFDVLAEAAQLGLPLEITALAEESSPRWNVLALQPFCKAPRILLATCSSEQLKEAHRRLGRHARRLAARGVQLKRRQGSDSALVRELYARKAAQPDSLFADPLRREFMERICHEEAEACEIFTYETQNDLVAALVTFRSGSTRHFYTVYFDTDWAHFSPGQVLLYEASAATLAEHLDCDFMTGEYPYKMRLANHTAQLLRVQVSAEEWQRVIATRLKKVAA